jgi:flagellar biosynthetic protein FliO
VPRRPSFLRAIHTTLACALGLLLVGVTPAFAADTFKKDTTPLSPEATGAGDSTSTDVGSSGGAIVRMLIGLAIVIAVIYAIYALLKRANGRKGGGVRSDGKMTVLASTSLAPGAAVHLVQVGDELVLVGQGQQGVTPIRVYTADEAQRLGVALDRGVTPFVPTGRPAASGKAGAGGFKRSFGASFVDELRKRTTRG